MLATASACGWCVRYSSCGLRSAAFRWARVRDARSGVEAEREWMYVKARVCGRVTAVLKERERRIWDSVVKSAVRET